MTLQGLDLPAIKVDPGPQVVTERTDFQEHEVTPVTEATWVHQGITARTARTVITAKTRDKALVAKPAQRGRKDGRDARVSSEPTA